MEKQIERQKSSTIKTEHRRERAEGVLSYLSHRTGSERRAKGESGEEEGVCWAGYGEVDVQDNGKRLCVWTQDAR